MIYFVTTMSIPDSIENKVREAAMSWSEKILKYAQEKWPEREMELMVNIDGKNSDIHWKTKHESMAAIDKWGEQYWNDDGVKALIDEVQKKEKELGTTFFTNWRNHYYWTVEPE